MEVSHLTPYTPPPSPSMTYAERKQHIRAKLAAHDRAMANGQVSPYFTQAVATRSDRTNDSLADRNLVQWSC